MASVHHLLRDASYVKQDIVTKYEEYAETDKNAFFSSVIIQRNWRCYSARTRFLRIRNASVAIQRYTRGYLTRKELPKFYDAYFNRLCEQYYNERATKIQALWRGYVTRCKRQSIQALIHNREEVKEMTAKFQEKMQLETIKAQEEIIENARQEHKTAMRRCLWVLFDRHHLIRTKIREGVLSDHGSEEFSDLEKILQHFAAKDYMKKLHKILGHDFIQGPIFRRSNNEKEFDLNTTIIKREPYERKMWYQE